MKIKVLIFDFDGTIADTFQSMIEISNHLAGEFNFKKIEAHEVEDYKDKTSQEMLKLLKVSTLKVPRIALRAKKELNKRMYTIKPVKGLKEILGEIKSLDYKMGILTSNSLENVNKFLEQHDLDFFDFVLTSSRFWGKNHGIKKLILQKGYAPQDILYIGDETRDIEAARKSSISVAAVTWGYNSFQALKNFQPDYILHSPQELLQ
ncbi:MAG TPA: HAD-IA family hydrolase, partial [Candidatus Omnitrophota bacterium]|nr:HAD-IA family hydrolase [Candidatus Omnitrophota bacterium]